MFHSTVNTKLIGLFGNPLGQSAAPYMHNSVYQALGIDCFYMPYEITTDDLEHVIKNLRRFHFAGASVTMPFKPIVHNYLDELDVSSQCTEVVNTVVIGSDGKLTGYNFDGLGCVRSLEKKGGISIPDHRYLVLGAGGAASAVLASLAQHGAKDIKILNIKEDFASAEKLHSRLEAFYPGVSSIDYMSDDTIKGGLASYDVVIHATKVGMFPKTDQALFDAQWLSPEHTICDVVYVPVETKLLKGAKARGCKTLSGLWMNVYVAAEQMRAWFGIEPPVDFMYLVGMNFLRSQGRLSA